MEEIEVKVLEIDVAAVTDRLAELGAEQVFDGRVRSFFFDFPDGRIEEDGLLRLRQRGDTTFVTLKQEIAKDDAKRMKEIQFHVDDFDTARTFLTALGLEQLHVSEKERTAWEDENVLYVIDRYPGIPPLLEVEAPSLAQVENAVTALGYSMDDAVSWDAQDVMDHYGNDEWNDS